MSAQTGVNAQILYDALETWFEPWRYSDIFPKKGLQFHNTDTVKKVYTATFASIPVLRSILDQNQPDALLYTHHPVPPKPDEDGNYGIIPEDILCEMAEKRLSLFSYHIAMDCNGTFSPAKTLAEALGLETYAPFYPQNGGHIGVLCNTECDTLDALAERMEQTLGHRISKYAFGNSKLENGRAAIMPGGARSLEIYPYLREQGINIFLTGVTNEQISWVKATHVEAERNGVSILGGTHYSTEMFAPLAMERFFARFQLETVFVPDSPNLLDL